MGQIISFFLNLVFGPKNGSEKDEGGIMQPATESAVEQCDKRPLVIDDPVGLDTSVDEELPESCSNGSVSSEASINDTLELLAGTRNPTTPLIEDRHLSASGGTGVTVNTVDYLYARDSEIVSEYGRNQRNELESDASDTSSNAIAECSNFLNNEQPTLELLNPNSTELDLDLPEDELSEKELPSVKETIEETAPPPNSLYSEASREPVPAEAVINFIPEEENKSVIDEIESSSMDLNLRGSAHANMAICAALKEVFEGEPGMSKEFVEKLAGDINGLSRHYAHMPPIQERDLKDGVAVSVCSVDVNVDSRDYIDVNLDHDIIEAVVTSKLANYPETNDSGLYAADDTAANPEVVG